MKKQLCYFMVLFISLLTSCGDRLLVDEQDLSQVNSITSTIDSSFVTKNQALRIAEGYSTTTRAGQQKYVSSVVALRDNVGDTLMYIVNYSGAQGYAVISATRNYHPVLAIVEKGSFSSRSALPEGENLYLDNYAHNISKLRTSPLDKVHKYREEWAAIDHSITSASTINTSDNDLNSFMNQSKVKWMNEGYDVSDLNQDKFGLPEEYRQMILRDAYAYKQRDDYTTTSFVIRRPSSVTTTDGPLLTSEWGQDDPYNLLIFEKYNQEYSTGCVTTAMAQIMRYYKKPANYDWNNMPDRAYNSSNGQSIAKLMFDIAEDVHKKYGIPEKGGTSSDNDKALRTFRKFGYGKVEVVDHIPNDVASRISYYKHPVLMEGYDKNINSGHAWVCDGVRESEYDNQIYLMILSGNSPYSYSKYTEPTPGHQLLTVDFFHMNWGWDGDQNGWFSDDNITTGDTNFSKKRKDIINIY